MKIEQIQTDKLIPYARNARIHTEKQIGQIAGSIKEFGFTNPILIHKDNIVIAGHGRLLAAQKLSIKKVPCIRLEHLSENQRKAYALIDNKLTENSGWDYEILNLELEQIEKLEALDLEEIGFEIPNELDENGDTEGQDNIPENVETKCKEDDLWVLGDHRLLCGDCTIESNIDILMDGQKTDMCFADPPYNLGFEYNSHNDSMQEDEYKDFCLKWFENLKRVSDKIIVTPGTKNIAMWCNINPNLQGIGCWVKKNWITSCKISNLQQWEPILFYGPFTRSRHSDLYEINRTYQKDVNDKHPCPKQIELLDDIFNSYGGETILDIFMGSGSTLIACEKTNRKCYGMEIDPHYCDVIIKRWEDFSGKTATLDKNINIS